ncbi:ABC transporter ATP-binding protein [soil metagenome]
MKHKSLLSLWWVIKLQIQTSKAYFIWNFFYSVFDGVSPVANVYVVAKLITSVTAVAFQQGAATEVYKWLALLLILDIFDMVLSNINGLADRRFQQKFELVATEKFFMKLYDLSQEQFDDGPFNTKLGRAQDALFSVGRVLNELSTAFSSGINFVSAIGAVLVVAPVVGLIVAATVIPIALLRVRQNRAIDAAYKRSESIDRIAYRSRWMLIDHKTMPEIRLMNAFKHLIHAWRTNMKKSQDIVFNTEKGMLGSDIFTDIMPRLVNFLANIYFFRLLVAGSLGLDRFIFMRGILEQASGSASGVANSIERLHELSINMHNFSEIQETPPAIPNGSFKVQRPLTIVFSHVSFSYPGTEQLALDDVSFLIVPGSKLALVGENGAGKTTLLKLLLRQYLPSSGTITINGTDIREVQQESYYAAISNLSQDFLVVDHLSIKDNLLMGLEQEVSDKQIMDTAELVGAKDFINKLKHKMDQRLDSSFDDGTGLSGGQLQRLGVARSLLRSGDIMILDEPTSAIDAKGEYMIFNNIYKAHGDRTTLIVSHRFSTVRKADKIIVMEKGKITEYGSHEELLAHGKLYKEMFEAQAEGYK